MATSSTVTARLAALRATIDQNVADALRTAPITYGGRGPGGIGVYPTNDRELTRVCRAMGLTVRKRDGEYRVAPATKAFSRSSVARAEAAAYYTTSRGDAFDTARAMATDAAHKREAIRTAECLRAIVEDMDAAALDAFAVAGFDAPHVNVDRIVADERDRRRRLRAFAEEVIEADGGVVAARTETHVVNVVLVALDGLTMSAQVTQRVHPSVLDATAWDVANEWCLDWRRAVRPVLVVIAAQDGSWCARYDVADDGTGELSRVPAQKAVR